jgi:hypothetical protein
VSHHSKRRPRLALIASLLCCGAGVLLAGPASAGGGDAPGGRAGVRHVAEDLDGDGVVETLTTYRDGLIVERRADTDGDRFVDAWLHYREGTLRWKEHDTDHDGLPDRVTWRRGEHSASLAAGPAAFGTH